MPPQTHSFARGGIEKEKTMIESEKVFEEWFVGEFGEQPRKSCSTTTTNWLYKHQLTKEAWSAALLWATAQKLGGLVGAIKLDTAVVEGTR